MTKKNRQYLLLLAAAPALVRKVHAGIRGFPEKQWKITDEDWRNREKWDQYEVAVDEMIVRTSTEQAPWHIIEGNSKLYARIRVMEVVVEALEKKISLLQK